MVRQMKASRLAVVRLCGRQCPRNTRKSRKEERKADVVVVVVSVLFVVVDEEKGGAGRSPTRAGTISSPKS